MSRSSVRWKGSDDDNTCLQFSPNRFSFHLTWKECWCCSCSVCQCHIHCHRRLQRRAHLFTNKRRSKVFLLKDLPEALLEKTSYYNLVNYMQFMSQVNNSQNKTVKILCLFWFEVYQQDRPVFWHWRQVNGLSAWDDVFVIFPFCQLTDFVETTTLWCAWGWSRLNEPFRP